MGSSPITHPEKSEGKPVTGAGFPFLLKNKKSQVGSWSAVFELVKGKSEYPYKEARLVIPKDPESNWYVIYYAWDVQKKKLIRKRTEKYIRDKKTDRDKKKAAEKLIREINNLLESGYHIDNLKLARIRESDENTPGGITLEDAIKLYLKKQKLLKESSFDSSEKLIRYFYNDLAELNMLTARPVEIDADWLSDYQAMIMSRPTARKTLPSNRYVNNRMNEIKSLMLYCKRKRWIEINPFEEVKSLPNSTGRNLAFSTEQQQELVEYMKEHKPYILFLCQFMYYTIARTNEISLLRIRDIGKMHKHKIFLAAEYAKNNIERHITITEQLQELIDQHKLKNYPANWFIFSTGFKPGPKQNHKLGNYFRRQVLDNLGYDKDYTLYSWKHTGVVNLYNAGISKADIKKQGGWKYTSSLETYLKSLGLEENETIRLNYPSLP